MSREALDALRTLVHDDPVLARRLAGIAPERFPAELVRCAADLRLDVTPADIEDGIAAGRRAWLMRWLR
jgi:hypothetical protein